MRCSSCRSSPPLLMNMYTQRDLLIVPAMLCRSGLHLLARKVHRRKTAERTGFDLQTHMKVVICCCRHHCAVLIMQEGEHALQDLLDGREVGVFWDWRSAGIPFRHATKVPAPLQVVSDLLAVLLSAMR